MRILYITYFGVANHLVQTQVLPYLKALADDGHDITLLSFEPEAAWTPEGLRELEAVARGLGSIRWKRLRYHKRFSILATAFDVLAGTLTGLSLIRRYTIKVVHARTHVPAAIGLLLQRLLGTKLVFDVRGLMAEEYVDAGQWKPGSAKFRMTKWVEARAAEQCSSMIVLTDWAKRYFQSEYATLVRGGTPIEVIPCCFDAERFRNTDDRAMVRRQLGLSDEIVLAYCGSLGGWYMAAEMTAFFKTLWQQQPKAHFLVLTQSDHSLIEHPLTELGIPREAFTITTASVERLPSLLAAADMAISFIRPTLSKRASSPTKIGEYLAAGLPIIANSGIGDVEYLLVSQQVGTVIHEFSESAYAEAAREILRISATGAAIREHCRAVADRTLSLSSVGAEAYCRVYRRMAADTEREPFSASVVSGATEDRQSPATSPR